MMRIVLDTSVLVAAARSRDGASHALVASIPNRAFIPCLSVALYAEWQDVLARREHLPPGMTAADAAGFLRFLAAQSHLQEIHFLWRPFLRDADDDMVLELAVACGASFIVTHNTKDFRRAAGAFNIPAITPADFHALIHKEAP